MPVDKIRMSQIESVKDRKKVRMSELISKEEYLAEL